MRRRERWAMASLIVLSVLLWSSWPGIAHAWHRYQLGPTASSYWVAHWPTDAQEGGSAPAPTPTPAVPEPAFYGKCAAALLFSAAVFRRIKQIGTP